MNNSNQFFKYLSIFLLGLILGYLFRGINLSGNAVSTITENGSIKVIGQNNAPITMVEYSDFQCPLCKKFYEDALPIIMKNYVETGKVKLVYKQFPLSIHPQAPAAAMATECALEQNKFWEMHDLLFKNQASWSGNPSHIAQFKQLAGQLGLDQKQFDNCLDTQKHLGNVNKDYQEGINKAVRGTPTFYINDQIIVGAQDAKVFTDMLDQLLQNPAAATTAATPGK